MSKFEAECCTHDVHIDYDCEACSRESGIHGVRRFAVKILDGGPFDGDMVHLWWEGKPVEFHRTTVPSEDSSFTRVYWFRWQGPGWMARMFSYGEVPRDDRQAARMRKALGLEDA